MKPSALALFAMLVACALPAGAQDASTVKVGQETKKITGTVIALNSGDVACYLTLKDGQGVEFKEMADFEIC